VLVVAVALVSNDLAKSEKIKGTSGFRSAFFRFVYQVWPIRDNSVAGRAALERQTTAEEERIFNIQSLVRTRSVYNLAIENVANFHEPSDSPRPHPFEPQERSNVIDVCLI